MYERFTNIARKVMRLANRESQRFNHEYIGTEHILLGLILVPGVATDVLRKLDIELRRIRLDVETLVQRGPYMVTMGQLPMTPAAKRVVEFAQEESWKLKHKQVDTEHILLGLLRAEGGVARQILMNSGLRMDEARKEIELALFQQSVYTGEALPMPSTRSAGAVELPQACPRCGHVPVVRIIWGCVRLRGQNLEDVKTGRAILGSYQSGEKGPPWACLRCAPKWAEVHRLVMQDYELQLEKEEAVAATDFDRAKRCLDGQLEARRQLAVVIEGWLWNQ